MKTAAEIDEILRTTLEDHRLSRSERKAIQADIGRPGNATERGLWKSRAFEWARRAVAEHPAEALLWLEDVMKALDAGEAERDREPVAENVAYFSPGNECWQEIVRRLEFARTAVDICVFTITDDRITRAIMGAHGRGVRLRVLSDDQKSGDLGSDIEQIQASGVAVRTDRDLAHMHHKFAIIDGRYLINGSYNWTRGAAAENRENIVTTTEPSLLDSFQREFEALWERFA